MLLDRQACYRALRTRDARFDGRFFTAVRSTGVYCRPICPARTPRLDNCIFVASAAAAEELGCRPCLRCRPEASPGTPAWAGSSALVSRALRLVGGGALDGGRVDTLARRLGISERHLRRLFVRHLGASPARVASVMRVQFAKKLIDETKLPMIEIALAAGFSSVRRFNEAFRETYDRSPRELRGHGARSSGEGLTLRLAYRPPYPWSALLAYLGARAIPGVESVGGGAYRRSVLLDGARGWVEVRQVPRASALSAALHVEGSALLHVVERLRRLFDLSADPLAIDAELGRDPRLRNLVARLPGLRVPGAWDGFELAVRAILGQQVTVQGATTLAGRLARRFGTDLGPVAAGARDPGIRFTFPCATTLADADLSRIGLTRARAASVTALARAVAGEELKLDGSRSQEETLRGLETIPGIGPWTAQYVAMRALGAPDAFPSGDLGLRRAAANGAGRELTATELERLAEDWRPWRAYAAMHLWTGLAPGSIEGPRR